MRDLFAVALGVFVLGFTQFGCKGDRGPVGPPGQLLSGSLLGQVSVVDEDSAEYYLRDCSGVSVSVSALHQSTTDYHGWWLITDVMTGTYTIAFSKPGYGTYKLFGFQFIGGDTVYCGSVRLGNEARHVITSLSATVSETSIRVSGLITPRTATRPHYRYFVLFMDTTASVSPSRYLDSQIRDTPDSIVQATYYSYYLRDIGVTSGARVFMVCYGLGAGSYNARYFDPKQRRYIYPTLSQNPSNVVNVLAP